MMWPAKCCGTLLASADHDSIVKPVVHGRKHPNFPTSNALKKIAKFIARNLLRWVDNPRKLHFFGEPLFRLAGFRKRMSRTETPVNVAVIKLDRMGDVMLCSRFLAGLRQSWPAARITFFVRESLVDLAHCCPDVDEVIGVPVDEGTMMFIPQNERYNVWNQQLVKWLKFCRHGSIWRKRFDAALVPRWDTDYYGAVPLAYLIGASQRWGVAEAVTPAKAVSNYGFDRLLTHVVEGKGAQHEALLNESFLQALGIQPVGDQTLKPWIVRADQAKAGEIMAAAGVVAFKKTLVVCMGAGLPSRMWPVERYARLFSAALNFEKVQLVTLGTLGEKNLGRCLKKTLGDAVVNLEGKLPLGLLPAAVSLGKLYIGSDTGTKHLAVAAGLPVFEINCHPLDGNPHLAESPVRFGPWAVPGRVIQPEHATAPCKESCVFREAHCILGISDERLEDALRSFLREIGMNDVCLK